MIATGQIYLLELVGKGSCPGKELGRGSAGSWGRIQQTGPWPSDSASPKPSSDQAVHAWHSMFIRPTSHCRGLPGASP